MTNKVNHLDQFRNARTPCHDWNCVGSCWPTYILDPSVALNKQRSIIFEMKYSGEMGLQFSCSLLPFLDKGTLLDNFQSVGREPSDLLKSSQSDGAISWAVSLSILAGNSCGPEGFLSLKLVRTARTWLIDIKQGILIHSHNERYRNSNVLQFKSAIHKKSRTQNTTDLLANVLNYVTFFFSVFLQTTTGTFCFHIHITVYHIVYFRENILWPDN